MEGVRYYPVHAFSLSGSAVIIHSQLQKFQPRVLMSLRLQSAKQSYTATMERNCYKTVSHWVSIYLYQVFPLFQIVDRFNFSRYIFTIYLDIVYIYMHSKSYKFRKIKTTYNLEWSEQLISILEEYLEKNIRSLPQPLCQRSDRAAQGPTNCVYTTVHLSYVSGVPAASIKW